jgi:hypothetical protein
LILLLKAQELFANPSSLIIIYSLNLLKEIGATQNGIQPSFLQNLILLKVNKVWHLLAHIQLIFLYIFL